MRNKAMRHVLVPLGAVALLAGSGAALGANFEGFYYGFNVGGAMGETKTRHSINKPIVNNPVNHANTVAGVAALDPAVDGNRLTFGGQLGYNWRFGRLIVGAEADANYLGIDEKADEARTHATNNGTREVKAVDRAEATYVATLRGRLGMLLGERAMAYVTAGLALSDLQYSNVTTITGGFVTATYPSDAAKSKGKAFGVGYEYAFSDSTSLRLEYQTLRFDEVTVFGSPGPLGNDLQGSTVNSSFKTRMNFLRVGMNWRF